MQEDIEQKPLSYYFDRAVVEEMLELLEKGYTVPYLGFGAFSCNNHWYYTFIRNGGRRMFHFKRQFPFITVTREEGDRRIFHFECQLPFGIGADGKPNNPTFEELFLEKLQDLLGEMTRLEA